MIFLSKTKKPWIHKRKILSEYYSRYFFLQVSKMHLKSGNYELAVGDKTLGKLLN